jgi:aminodeoxyfutalosine deaminase
MEHPPNSNASTDIKAPSSTLDSVVHAPSSASAQWAFVTAMPKAELHVHLEGSITPTTLLTLAKNHAMEGRLPSTDPDDLADWFRFTDFPHFIEVYLTISDCLRNAEDFELIVDAYAEAAARQAIVYAEVTVTPFTHTHIQDKGLSINDILRGLESGRSAARRKHGVELNWIFDVPRNFSFPNGPASYDPTPADITLEYALRGRAQGVIGFGLGGHEVGAPPAPFAHAFRKAVAAGLLSVPHAGETQGADSVWGALQALQAQRLGHGVRAIEDPDLLHLLRVTQTPLEINISSNIRLHVYDCYARHPLPFLDQMGLLVTVNSDDPPLFNTTLVEEYMLLFTEYGYSPADVARIARNAFLAAAVPRATRRRLLVHFDTWLDAQSMTHL